MNRAARVVLAMAAPVLLAVFPLLSLFAQNETDVEISVLWWPLLLTIAGVLVSLAVLTAVVRDPVKASVLTSVVALGFFYYGLVSSGGWWLFSAWTTATIVLIAAVVRTPRRLVPALLALAAAGATTAVPQAVRIALWQSRHPMVAASDARLWPTALSELPRPSSPATRPDIFVIIPDDYARPDVLASFFHYDDHVFLDALRQRGFTVSGDVQSPYSDSESNIASALNMDYLDRFATVLGPTSQDVRPVKAVSADSRAARLLVSAGYRYVHIDTDNVTFPGSNPHISSFAPPDGFPNLWMRKSVLRQFGGRLGFADPAINARYRRAIDSQLAALQRAGDDGRPTFVVFHTLLPHDPYVYDAAGHATTFPGHSDTALASDLGRSYYVHQVEALNARLLTTIDRIRATASTPPVIVVQSDEGFQADPALVGEDTMKRVRVRGLLAVALPGQPSAAARIEPATTINTLRVVLNTYCGSHYPLLPARSYAEGDYPYQPTPIEALTTRLHPSAPARPGRDASATASAP